MAVSLSFEPFALWNAKRHNPALAATPLVALAGERVAAANAAARRAGIEIGMGRAGARAHAAELHEVATTSPQLESAWRGVVTELYALTPRLEAGGLGVAYLQLGEREVREVAAAFGARAGVAASREHARLLSLAARPGEVRSGGAEAVARLPLAALRGLGIAGGTLQRLAWLGLERLGELQRWSPAQLGALFGPEATAVIRHLHGPFSAHVPRFTPPPAVRTRFAFDDAASEPAELEPVLTLLASCAAAQLGDRAAGRLTLTASAQGIGFDATRSAKLPLRTPETVERLARLALADSGAQPLGIDELTLELGELTRPSHQGGLWPRRERLERAIAGVEGRYPGSLLRIEPGDPFALAFEHRARFTAWRPEGGECANGADADRGRPAPRIAQPRG